MENTKRNMLTLREIQMVEYNILCELTKYFEKNGIHYILCGGTMLGAVRHNGFIPWDDDIDLLVPREDYEKVRKIYSEKDDIGGIKLKFPGDKGFPYPFIKAVDPNYVAVELVHDEEYRANVWVDVFPMDHFPDEERKHRKYVFMICTLIKILSSNTITKDYLKGRGYYSNPAKMLKLVGSRILFRLLGGKDRIAKRIDKIAHRMDTKYKTSNHVGDGAWPNGMKDYFPLSAVEPVMKHKFEEGEFNIPVNYDAYLSHFYGDYMRVPPPNERVDHHITV